jgi:hypothetical protein
MYYDKYEIQNSVSIRKIYKAVGMAGLYKPKMPVLTKYNHRKFTLYVINKTPLMIKITLTPKT